MYLLKKQFVWLQNQLALIGIDDVCGFTRPGYDADFIDFVTKDLQLEETFLGGRAFTRLKQQVLSNTN